MPQVDFYILNINHGPDADRFVCRLTETAYRQGLKIFINTASEQEAARLDDLLWTYKEESFLPHDTLNQHAPHILPTPILIGTQINQTLSSDTLINLSENIPDELSSFKRIAEVIHNDEHRKSSARQRFKCYRNMGCHLKTHAINL